MAHPRCVFVIAADEANGRPYIVMELMPGATLQDVVSRDGPLPVESAISKILDVIDGLCEAHRLGVVHRDVKPSNCFVEADGRVKVGDFGLAKSLVGGDALTRTGAFLGTPLFASPEQIKGETVGAQSDVYSVAATLYCLLTGQAPFQGGDAAATLARIVSEAAPPMRSLRPDLSATLDKVVLRGLERDQAKRWRDLDEFRAALLPFLPGRLSIGGLGVRFGAYLIDIAFLTIPGLLAVFLVVVLTGGGSPWTPQLRVDRQLLQMLAGVVVWVLYFGGFESLWGCTPGKYFLGLRVCRAKGSERPGLAAVMVRVGLFYLLENLGAIFFAVVLVYNAAQSADLSPEHQMGQNLLALAFFYPLSRWEPFASYARCGRETVIAACTRCSAARAPYSYRSPFEAAPSGVAPWSWKRLLQRGSPSALAHSRFWAYYLGRGDCFSVTKRLWAETLGFGSGRRTTRL